MSDPAGANKTDWIINRMTERKDQVAKCWRADCGVEARFSVGDAPSSDKPCTSEDGHRWSVMTSLVTAEVANG
jgi:hypothetical protein